MKIPKWARPTPLIIDIFVIVNLSFLALDIFIAHSTNEFSHYAEWIPFYFSLIAPILLSIEAWNNWKHNQSQKQFISIIVGSLAILVGITGLIWHLHSTFFEYQTLKSLVYTAPFIAPLAYTGLGSLLIMNRMIQDHSLEWSQWLIFFGFSGFVGNFILALSDHAQNGFFLFYEWIPVISSAIAVRFLGIALVRKSTHQFLDVTIVIMILQVGIGLLGLYFHGVAVFENISSSFFENIVYSAPIFAPLLFVNLAFLSTLGLIDLRFKNIQLDEKLP